MPPVSGLVVAFFITALVGGCDEATDDYLEKKIIASGTVIPDSDGLLTVVTTTGMVHDMVSAMMGNDAHVNYIMGPDSDPHDYQPSQGDAIRILNADIVVYNGLQLESHLDEVFQRRRNSGDPTIAVGELLPPPMLIKTDTGSSDPHVWMDVSLWSDAAERLARQLEPMVTFKKDKLHRRVREYQKQLTVLDRWGEAAVATIPESQRFFFATHDAFRYFDQRYGVRVRVFQDSLLPDMSATIDTDLTISLPGSHKRKVFFIEQTSTQQQIEAILAGTKQKNVDDSSEPIVLSDSLGNADSAQGTYLGMMKHNFYTVCSELGGDPDSVDWQTIVDEVELEMAEEEPEAKNPELAEEPVI